MKFYCPHCRQSLEVEDQWAGETLKCPTCDKTVVVPTLPLTGQKAAATRPVSRTPLPSTTRREPMPTKRGRGGCGTLLLTFLVLGVGAFGYATWRFNESPQQIGNRLVKYVREITHPAPPVIPTPTFAPIPETSPRPTLTPAPEPTATPAPEAASTPKPAPEPAADTLSWLTQNRAAWPKEVTLLVTTEFGLMINDVDHGTIEAKPGTRLTVQEIEKGYISVALGEASKRLPISATDLAARAPEAMRVYLRRQQTRQWLEKARQATAPPVTAWPLPAEAASGSAPAPRTIVTDSQNSTGFESEKDDSIHSCTVQKPNYGDVVTLSSEHLPRAAGTGIRCMKFFWTEEGYNGTRMTRGTEACASLNTYKEGWSGFYLYLPDPGYPLDKEAACAQIFQKGHCNSWGATLEIKNNSLWVNHRHFCGDPVKAEVAKDIPRNRWIPIIIHFVASHEGRGKFQVWFDKDAKGSPSYDARNINFGFGDWNQDDSLGESSPIGPKWGQYNYAAGEYTKGETRTSYYDNISFVVGHPKDGWDLVHPLGSLNVPGMEEKDPAESTH